jgi:MFS family permease
MHAAGYALLPLALLGAPGRAESRGQKASRPVGARVWREPLFWLVFAANVGLGYLQLLPTHQVAHLTLVGLPSLLAATAGGLMGACIGIGALLGGWWVDRWGPGRFGPIGAALFCLGVLGLLGSGPAALGLTAAYVLAGGLGRGTLGVVTAVVQARAFAGPSLGRVSGMFDVGFGLGSFAGPYLTALGRDLSGSYAPGLATCIPAALLVTATTAWARAIQAGQESPAADVAGRPAGCVGPNRA